MKKQYLTYLWLCLLALTGCLQEEDVRKNGIPGNGFVLNYTIDTGIASKATIPATGEENTIRSMYTLFFEPTTLGTGQLLEVYTVVLENALINGEFNSIPIDFTDNKYTNLQATGEYNLLIAANVEYYIRANDITFDPDDPASMEELRLYLKSLLSGRTESEVLESTYLRLGDEPLRADCLPMSGTAKKSKEKGEVDVILTRGVCRVDVINKDPLYELVSASIWNVYPRTTIWQGRFQTYDDEDPVLEYMMGNPETGEQSIEGQLYAYENYVAAPEQGDHVTTCVIVGLAKTGGNSTEYYRINVSVGDAGQQLKRNNLYRININSVLGNGKGTEQDAYEDTDMLISSDLNGWNIDESGIILFDGDNILALPYSRVNFTPGGGTFNLTIFTHGTGTLQITNEFLPDNMTVSLNNNELVINALSSDDDRQGMVEIGFGNLKGTITITQQGDQTEFLELSTTALVNFPPVPGAGQSPGEPVVVEASGKWDATIVCNQPNSFSFAADDDTAATLACEDPDGNGQFTIFLHSTNNTENALYGFVMVTLRSNPKISRVLLLTQDAAGGVELSAAGPFNFDPYGKTPTLNDSYTITVTALQNSLVVPWNVKKISGSDKFEVTKDNSSTLTIKAGTDTDNMQNTSGSEQKAVYRIFLEDNESRFQEITIIQSAHALSLTPSGNYGVMPSTGGQGATVTVTSTGPWTATLAATGSSPWFYIQNSNNKPTTVTGNSGDNFAVVFPENIELLVAPTATVTISIDGTNVSREVTFNQNSAQTRALNFVGWGTYGNLAIPTNNTYNVYHIKQMSDNIRNLMYFGPDGVVKIPPYSFTNLGTASNPTIPDNTDIYQINYSSVTANHARKIKAWKDESDKHVLFHSMDGGNYLSYLMSEGVIAQGFETRNDGTNRNTPRVLHPDYSPANNKLYKFLLEDGPFTENAPIGHGDISLIAYDAVTRFLTKWPDTFIPIIMYNYNGTWICGFGIDPYYQYIYCGEIDLFGNYGSSSVNYSGSPQAEANMKFLNNIIAYMTYSALYGNSFTDQFKELP
ncbi:MAG: hypothetical protein LUE98_04835 [Tannerellaceae bacterium]|nr:hypothetical protein [Tannerellaceae bacterium]